MPSFETKHRVGFSARQMFDLVADVERYPEFLPLCTGLQLQSRRAIDVGEELIARMQIGYKSINETFSTRVTLQPEAHRIDVSYLDGPFSRLENRWLFRDLNASSEAAASEVDFFIDYQFRSLLLGAVMSSVFDQAFRKFVAAFETRAGVIYGAEKRDPMV